MNKKIVIAGGGISGLSAGIYGQLNGFDTEIIEMHTIPGGQCTAWNRNGYRFDYCLHWLVGSSKGPFRDIWQETGIIDHQTQVVQHEIYMRMVAENGDDFLIHTDADAWEKYLINLAPEDKPAIRKMCNDIRTIGMLQPLKNAPGLRSWFSYLKALLTMGPAIRLLMKYSKTSFSSYIQGFNLKNEHVMKFLKRLYNDQNISAIAFLTMLGWYHRKNAGYLVGGSLQMALRMKEKYRSLGGTLSLGTTVSEIIVEAGKTTGVLLSDGRIVNGDYIISAVDGHATIFELLKGKYLTSEIKNAYENWEVFTPIVQVSFGIDISVSLNYPSQTFLSSTGQIGSTQLKQGYIVMNYAFDPTMAPKGKTVLIMRFASPWEHWKDLNGEAYTNEKAKIKADAINLMEQHFPEIKGHIEEIDIATPLTDVRYTRVWKGAYEGFLPSPTNITRSIKMTLPNLKNFYMIGQWLFPGGGLPPSAQSGKWVIQLICKKEKQKFRVN